MIKSKSMSKKVTRPSLCEHCKKSKPAARVTIGSKVVWMCKGCVMAAHKNVEAPSLSALERPDFTMDLQKLMETQPQTIGLDIPDIVAQVISFVEVHGLFVQGIYRQSGSKEDIEERKERYNRGRQNSLLKGGEQDPHAVAGLMKLWFRSLPNPLFTYELFEPIMAVADLPSRESIPVLQDLVKNKLSRANRFVAHALFTHLGKVADCCDTNMMTAENLAIVFGPNLIKKRDATPMDDLAYSNKITNVTRVMIQYSHEVFGFVGQEREQYRQNLPASRVMQAANRSSAAAAQPPAAGSPQLAPKGAVAGLKKQKPNRDSINF